MKHADETDITHLCTRNIAKARLGRAMRINEQAVLNYRGGK